MVKRPYRLQRHERIWLAQLLGSGHVRAASWFYIAPVEGKSANDLVFWSATVSQDNKTLYLKLVNASDRTEAIHLSVPNARDAKATTQTLHAATRWATNSIDRPTAVVPVQGTIDVRAAGWNHSLPGNTIQVIDIPLR